MIKSKRYKDTRTGEIKTQIPIMEMQYFVSPDKSEKEMV